MTTPTQQAVTGKARGARRRRPRRSVLLLLALLATLLLFEGVMQVGAYAVWLSQRKPVPEDVTGRDVILCVGDSWTHGMGSADPARWGYPALL